MFSLVYTSTASYTLPSAHLVSMLEASRERNQAAGITGMLLYRGGVFIQALEGSYKAVFQLYGRIQNDQRHKNVAILGQNFIEKRQFPDWSMSFLDIDQLPEEQLPGYTDFLWTDFTPEYFKDKPERAYILLLAFRDIMKQVEEL